MALKKTFSEKHQRPACLSEFLVKALDSTPKICAFMRYPDLFRTILNCRNTNDGYKLTSLPIILGNILLLID